MRGLQRYGIFLNSKARKEIINQIATNKSKFVRRISNARTEHIVTVEGTEMSVLYDKNHSTIITVLPKHALRRAKQEINKRKNGYE